MFTGVGVGVEACRSWAEGLCDGALGWGLLRAVRLGRMIPCYDYVTKSLSPFGHLRISEYYM